MKEDAVAYTSVANASLRSTPALYLVADTSRQSSIEGIIKRWLDVFVAGVSLLVLAPALLVIALLVKRSGPGPVFFVQERIGKDGRPFRFYKFRTMTHNSDDAIHRQFATMFINGGGSTDGKIYKMTDDPRVTRIGQFLRKTSLDELPQLFNVLRGEMSLVGPRPPLSYEIEQYQPWHHERLRVLPGLTGLWQVSGRSNVTFDEMVRLDIHYINSWSLLFDLRIILRTIPVVLFGTGGY